jgi:hypothetical protein
MVNYEETSEAVEEFLEAQKEEIGTPSPLRSLLIDQHGISDEELVGVWFILTGRRKRLLVPDEHITHDPVLEMFSKIYGIGPTSLYRELLGAKKRVLEDNKQMAMARAGRGSPHNAVHRLSAEELSERNEKILERASSGEVGLRGLSEEFGLTRETIRLILRKRGFRMQKNRKLVPV